MKKIFSWHLPISIGTGFVLSHGATYLLVIQPSPVSLLTACVLACLIYSVIAVYHKFFVRLLPYLSGLILISLPLGAFRWFLDGYQEYAEWIWAYVPSPVFDRITLFLLTFAVTLPAFILIRCHSPVFIMMLAGSILFCGLDIAGYEYPRYLFWMFLFLMLLQMALASGAGSTAGMRIMTALPLCLVIVFLAGLFAGPGHKPMGFIRDWYDGISVFSFGSGTGGTTRSISSLNSNLGGPFNPNGTLMLTVHTQENAPYLRGGIGINYDGHRWTGDGYEGYQVSINEDILNWYGTVNKRIYDISYVSLRGAKLYLPPDLYAVMDGIQPRRDLIWHTGDIFYLEENTGEDLTYSAAAGIFERTIYQSSDFPEEPWDLYLALPDSLPYRVKNLANSLAVYGSDYYNALAIEQYLLEKYKYNPDMPFTPNNVDFVDYFLYTKKEGYCTYFASAMVVMCRAAGIPARFVDGFAPAVTQDSEGKYLYTDRQAHAWCEAYISGHWLQFEPTPGYNRSEPIDFPEPVKPSPAAMQPTPPETEPSPRVFPSPRNTDTPVNSSPGASQNRPFPWKTVLRYTLPALLLLGSWAALRIRRLRFITMLHTVPYGKEQAERVYRHLLWLVKHADAVPSQYETLLEFAERAGPLTGGEHTLMHRAAAIMNKCRYGRDPLTEEESRVLMDCALAAEENISVGAVRCWLYKKVLSII